MERQRSQTAGGHGEAGVPQRHDLPSTFSGVSLRLMTALLKGMARVTNVLGLLKSGHSGSVR